MEWLFHRKFTYHAHCEFQVCFSKFSTYISQMAMLMRFDLTILAPRGSSGIFSFGVRMVVVVGYLMLDLRGSLVQYPSKHGLISTCSPSRPHKF